jgi:hypothetical protein
MLVRWLLVVGVLALALTGCSAGTERVQVQRIRPAGVDDLDETFAVLDERLFGRRVVSNTDPDHVAVVTTDARHWEPVDLPGVPSGATLSLHGPFRREGTVAYTGEVYHPTLPGPFEAGRATWVWTTHDGRTWYRERCPTYGGCRRNEERDWPPPRRWGHIAGEPAVRAVFGPEAPLGDDAQLTVAYRLRPHRAQDLYVLHEAGDTARPVLRATCVVTTDGAVDGARFSRPVRVDDRWLVAYQCVEHGPIDASIYLGDADARHFRVVSRSDADLGQPFAWGDRAFVPEYDDQGTLRFIAVDVD